MNLIRNVVGTRRSDGGIDSKICWGQRVNWKWELWGRGDVGLTECRNGKRMNWLLM